MLLTRSGTQIDRAGNTIISFLDNDPLDVGYDFLDEQPRGSAVIRKFARLDNIGANDIFDTLGFSVTRTQKSLNGAVFNSPQNVLYIRTKNQRLFCEASTKLPNGFICPQFVYVSGRDFRVGLGGLSRPGLIGSMDVTEALLRIIGPFPNNPNQNAR